MQLKNRPRGLPGERPLVERVPYPEASPAASISGCRRAGAGMLTCLSPRLHRTGDQGFTVIPSSLPTDNCTEQRPGRQQYFLETVFPGGVMADAPSVVPPGVGHAARK